MPQPPDYNPVNDYTDWQTANPTDPIPGPFLDADYNAISTSINWINDNLALIQRDDGKLGNETVDWDQLDPDVVGAITGETGAVPTKLNDLDDVIITSPQDGQYLTYDSGIGEWVNGAAPGIGSLNDLADVDTTDVSDGDCLVFDNVSGEWVPGARGDMFKAENLSGLADNKTSRENLEALGQGRHSYVFSAASLLPVPQAGETDYDNPPVETDVTATNKVRRDYRELPPAEEIFLQAELTLPISATDGQTMTGRVIFEEAPGATTHGIVFSFKAQAQGEGDSPDAVWGASSSVTLSGAADQQLRAEFTGIAIAGPLQKGDKLYFTLSNNVQDGAYSIDVGLRILELQLDIDINKDNDE